MFSPAALSHPLSRFFAVLFSLNLAVSALALDVTSPDGKLTASLTVDPSGQLVYSLSARGKPVILPSPVGITVDGENLGEKAKLASSKTDVINETYPTLGVHATAVNRANAATIRLTGGEKQTPWTLEVRAYNDGAAYRYRVPGTGERQIGGEASTWTLPAGGTIWFQSSESRDYEKPFFTAPLDGLAQDKTIMSDCVIKLPGELGYVMPTEANLVNYSDMVLRPAGPARFQAEFPHDSQGWKQPGEIVSPWRVTIYSPDLNGLVNTDLLRNLCPAPAPALAQAKWIVPGRASWHWMVSGSPKFEEQGKWVDWTHQLGFEYYLIDDGWVRWRDQDKDQWACMRSVVDEARAKNVKIWAWVNTKEVTAPADRTAYFQKAKAAGLAGLKIDFMGPPNHVWMNWYDETLRDAAANELMVDFHGCVKPTGRERTWPHELTREGIRGRENGKQTGLHDTTLPFTRYVQGHADFTPTDFRGEKLHGASYAHELAQAVVYTSALLCYGGSPQNYLDSAAVDVLKAIPATWDETVVLPGSAVGEVAAFARRKGSQWFVGVVNGSVARDLEIPLKFLPLGSWQLDQLADDPAKNDQWNRSKEAVGSGTVLKTSLRGEGGFVARLTR